jgi:hypothetical protein
MFCSRNDNTTFAVQGTKLYFEVEGTSTPEKLETLKLIKSGTETKVTVKHIFRETYRFTSINLEKHKCLRMKSKVKTSSNFNNIQVA